MPPTREMKAKRTESSGTTTGEEDRRMAAAAGVTEMTFYRHFGTKDQLLLDDPYDPLMAGAVAAQPPGLPPVIRAVRGIRAAWRAVPIQDTGPVRDRLAIVAATPSLAAAVRANTAASEAAIGAELAAGGADPREAAIAAAAVKAALMTALLLGVATSLDPRPLMAIVGVVNSIVFLTLCMWPPQPRSPQSYQARSERSIKAKAPAGPQLPAA